MKKWISTGFLLLTGCAHFSQWKYFEPVNEPTNVQSLVYVYHDCSKGKIEGQGITVAIEQNDKAYMPKGSYFATYLNVGKTLLTSTFTEKKYHFQFNTKPAQTVYLKLQSNDDDSVTTKQIPHQIAKKEIKNCRLAKSGYYTSTDAS
ncbi:hypothetical protein SOPP22_12795 [Shewanella sp. OPT22]|nr:hypothetical protein SOPP22_12795 [Shewanella sp. OPT22]